MAETDRDRSGRSDYVRRRLTEERQRVEDANDPSRDGEPEEPHEEGQADEGAVRDERRRVEDD